MPKLYFEIIEKKRSKMYYFLYTAAAILFLAVIISALFEENKKPPHVRTLTFTFALFIVIAVTLVRSFIVKEFKKLGQIHFTENEIKIVKPSETASYSLDQIQNLQIEVNDTADDPAGIRRMANLEGINNYVRFVYDTSKQHEYRIFIEGVSSLRLLDRFLKNWDKKKYTLTGSRSITNY